MLVFIVLSSFVCYVHSQCTDRGFTYHTCEWSPWWIGDAWNTCTATCGGGTQYRTRRFCCDGDPDITGCLNRCGLTDDGFREYRICNPVCDHGGEFRQLSPYAGYCACKAGFYGHCCDQPCPEIRRCKEVVCTTIDDATCFACRDGYVLIDEKCVRRNRVPPPTRRITSTTTPSTTSTKIQNGAGHEVGPVPLSSFVEQQLVTFLQESVICHPNAVTVFAPLHLIPVTAEVTWLDPSCHFWSNGSHYFSTIGFHDCGMKVALSDDSVTLENALVVKDMQQTLSPLVDFGESVSFAIPVSCGYPRRENLTASFYPIRQSRRVFVKRHGHLDMYMNQYSNAEFSQVSSQPVPLGSNVFIKLGVEQLNRSELAIMVDRCIATPSYSPADSTFYSLIENSCPSSPMVNMYPSTQNEVRFHVRSFMFRSAGPSIVYIHCEASICHKANPGCNRDCRRRKKRGVSGKHSSHLLSTGPIYVTADKGSDKGTYGSNIAAAVFAVIAFVAIVIAVIGWRKRYIVANRYSTLQQ